MFVRVWLKTSLTLSLNPLQLGILVRLLDNFLMPDDLPPIGEDEQYVYSLPGRKDDKQLYRLMLANAEAEGEQQLLVS